LLAFNGATAAKLYDRLVHGRMSAGVQALPRVRLPSTSPAHAAMRYAEKLSAWAQLVAARDAAALHAGETSHS
jgi:G:T/U-mismatch repair DNA glycosylase